MSAIATGRRGEPDTTGHQLSCESAIKSRLYVFLSLNDFHNGQQPSSKIRVFNRNLAAVIFDKLLRDEKTDPCPAIPPRYRCLGIAVTHKAPTIPAWCSPNSYTDRTAQVEIPHLFGLVFRGGSITREL